MIKKIMERNNSFSFFSYKDNFLSKKDYNFIKKILENTQDWKEGLSYSGKNIKRKQKWFHENKKYFCKNWKQKYKRWESHNYNNDYYYIQEIIQKYIDKFLENKKVNIPKLNSILLNYYKDGNNKIGFHKDNKDSFGEYPTIIILSIGDERTLRFEKTISGEITRNKNKENNFDIKLKDNSIFIMGGNSQKDWVHSIIEEDNKKERYSLTFREHIL